MKEHEARRLNILGNAFKEAQRLRGVLSSMDDAVSALSDGIQQLCRQVSCRVGTDWRNMGDDDLTTEKVDGPRNKLKSRLCALLEFLDTTNALWDQSVPANISDVAMLVKGNHEDSRTYLKQLQVFSTFYNAYINNRHGLFKALAAAGFVRVSWGTQSRHEHVIVSVLCCALLFYSAVLCSAVIRVVCCALPTSAVICVLRSCAPLLRCVVLCFAVWWAVLRCAALGRVPLCCAVMCCPVLCCLMMLLLF